MSETKPKPNPVNEPAAPVATKTLHIVKPLGHVTVPALVCGIVASFIAVALDLMKLYDSLILGVQKLYQEKPFYLEDVEVWNRSFDWLLAILVSCTVAYVVLDTAGQAKRVFIGVVVLLLTMMFSPLFMLWGAFWFPIVVIVAIVLAWIFSFIYTSMHTMPCELGMKVTKKKRAKKEKAPKKEKKKSEPAEVTAKEPEVEAKKVGFEALNKS